MNTTDSIPKDMPHYANPFNQVIRGGWLNLQSLVKRGASPNGPAWGYKQATDEKEWHPTSLNPFNQSIRGAPPAEQTLLGISLTPSITS